MQSKHCFARYNEYVQCMNVTKGSAHYPHTCDRLRVDVHGICPDEWMEWFHDLHKDGRFFGVELPMPEEEAEGVKVEAGEPAPFESKGEAEDESAESGDEAGEEDEEGDEEEDEDEEDDDEEDDDDEDDDWVEHERN